MFYLFIFIFLSVCLSFIYVFIYLCHLSVHYMHALPTRGQKGASGSLALELQVIVSWHEDSG